MIQRRLTPALVAISLAIVASGCQASAGSSSTTSASSTTGSTSTTAAGPSETGSPQHCRMVLTAALANVVRTDPILRQRPAAEKPYIQDSIARNIVAVCKTSPPDTKIVDAATVVRQFVEKQAQSP